MAHPDSSLLWVVQEKPGISGLGTALHAPTSLPPPSLPKLLTPARPVRKGGDWTRGLRTPRLPGVGLGLASPLGLQATRGKHSGTTGTEGA